MFKDLSQNNLYRLFASLFLLPILPSFADTFQENIQLSPIISIDEESTPIELPSKSYPTPGLTFGVPSGYGASDRSFFVGLSYGATVDNGPFTFFDSSDEKVADGSMIFGLGLGNADNLAAEISLGIISLSCQNGESCFGADGTLGLKLHKKFDNSFVDAFALGYSDIVHWGEASDFATIYAAASKDFKLIDKKALFTLGIGTGSFRTQDDFLANKNSPNLFTGIGVMIAPRLSLSSSWNGSALNAGFGISPFNLPISISTGITDITDVKDEGTRYSFNIGYSFSF